MMGSRHLESRAKNGDEEFGRRTTRLSSAEENGTVKKRHASGKIKEEDTGDEIREYAATTMSELLGWYGYEKVDSGCTRSLNLDHFASRSKLSEMDRNCVSEGRSSRSPLSVNTSSSSSFEVLPGLPLSYSAESLKISPSLTMKPIHSAGRFLHKSYSTSSCTENLVSCSWCGRLSQTCDPGRSNGLPYSVANALGQFCSEACFAAGRRAVFKRARTCDWCRHVRNPINYVDLQDGESQLQFCSDKCLNQYKMNIFCHETRTHLTLHGLDNIPFHDGEKGGLITPELWFRNCQSPAHSTTDEVLIVDDQSSNDESPASSILEDRRRVDEDTKKPPRSDSKTRKRKNSFRVRKHARSSETGNNFAGSQEEQNQLDRHESLSNQENQNFYRFANPYHYRINCTDSGPPNYSSSVSLEAVKTDKPLSTDFDNRGDSSDRKEGNRANNIHVKDVRELQDERAYDRLIKSPPWLSDSIQFKTPSSQKPFACDSTRTKYRRQTESFPRMTPFVGPSESRQSSTNHPASSLLPPVTVLVPYPIPIPIPIPIPVPSTVFERLAKKQKENTDKNCSCSCSCKSSKRESDCESTTSDPPSRLSTDLAADSSQDSSSCCHLTASSTNEKNEEEDEDARRVTARPSRKRKRTKVENVEGLQVKRRNKFVAA